jgi:hypothetical protein
MQVHLDREVVAEDFAPAGDPVQRFVASLAANEGCDFAGGRSCESEQSFTASGYLIPGELRPSTCARYVLLAPLIQ